MGNYVCRRLAFGVLLLGVSSSLFAAKLNPELITADRLRSHLEFVASDLMEGRNTPSRGLDITARYLVTQCKLMGLQPAGETKTFFHWYETKTRGGATIKSQNVIAKIEGSDPKLKDEYIAISAHYDHIGLESEGSDRINNGADDDGSGTVALLEIARAIMMGPKPKRSILFIWHSGEERGLLGSKAYTETPTVDLKKIAGLINIDMIGRARPAGDTNPKNEKLVPPRSIYVVGSRELSTEFGDWVAKANDGYLKLKYDYYYDQPSKPDRIYFRSDHYNYAVKGIPIVFFFNGTHEDYHQVSDEVDKIDFPQFEAVARTILVTLYQIADKSTRPKMNAPAPASF